LLYRRHGENQTAKKYIDAVLGSKNTPKDILATFTKINQSLAMESYWQGLAADRFYTALTKGTITPQNKTMAKYLLGQLYFRLGRTQDAKRWLSEAIVDRKLPDNINQWAKETQRRLP